MDSLMRAKDVALNSCYNSATECQKRIEQLEFDIQDLRGNSYELQRVKDDYMKLQSEYNRVHDQLQYQQVVRQDAQPKRRFNPNDIQSIINLYIVGIAPR